MKKLSYLIVALSIVAVAVTGNAGFSLFGVGAVALTQSFKTSFAAISLVPALTYVVDPNGLIIEVPPMTRAEKAMYDYLRTKSNQVTLDAVKAGAISFDPLSYYIRYAITGLSGRQQILNQATQKVVGVCNLNQGVLGQYYNFCFDRIRVGYANDADTASVAPQALASYSSVRGLMPAALANAEIVVQSNRNDIINAPISDFTSSAEVTGGGQREYDGGILEKPRFFLEQLQVTVDLDLAFGQTIPAGTTTSAVEVIFSGIQTRLRF